MKRFAVSLHPAAELEFEQAFIWYTRRSALAADGFRAEVIDAIDGLSHSALMWPKDEDGFHHLALSRFPFTVWYQLDGDSATVLAIAHQRRRPGYWAQRKP